MNGKRKGSKVRWNVLLWGMIFCSSLVSFCFGGEDPAKFPTKPITMIVHYSPGGSTDLTGRKLADLASKVLGQPIIVENKSGGGGVIGTTAVSKAAPDGYTVGTVTYGPTVFAPHLRSVPYETKKDFTYILQYSSTTLMFAVRADSPWKTFEDFIAEARKNPGKLNYSTPGPMTGQNIFMEQVFSAAKVKVNHVPGKGGTEATLLVLGGHTEAVFTSEVIPHVEAGKLRALAILLEQRHKRFPDVPTFLELGYKIEPITWMGLYGPKGIDSRILKKLYGAFKKAQQDPSFHELCATLNLTPVLRDPKSFKAKVFADFDANKKALKEFGKK
jgi:tripartite-type tricarboxylate transporter receptor subunit TctC